jgi:hypothetical protein
MPLVLTLASAVSCDHPPTGGGALTLAPAALGVLSVDGDVVLSGSLAPTAIGAGCGQTPPSSSTTPCLLTSSQSGGTSSVLKVDGKPVLLATAKGETNGKPDSKWSVKDAGHNLLQAD